MMEFWRGAILLVAMVWSGVLLIIDGGVMRTSVGVVMLTLITVMFCCAVYDRGREVGRRKPPEGG